MLPNNNNDNNNDNQYQKYSKMYACVLRYTKRKQKVAVNHILNSFYGNITQLLAYKTNIMPKQ
jgi:hypothetical protein